MINAPEIGGVLLYQNGLFTTVTTFGLSDRYPASMARESAASSCRFFAVKEKNASSFMAFR